MKRDCALVNNCPFIVNNVICNCFVRKFYFNFYFFFAVMSARNASHAGNWYPRNKKELSDKLEGWLSDASRVTCPVKAVIAPQRQPREVGIDNIHNTQYGVLFTNDSELSVGKSLKVIKQLDSNKTGSKMKPMLEKENFQMVQNTKSLKINNFLSNRHAGYSYCGAVGAHSYKQFDPQTIKRIFILGPSHHVYLPGCAVSGTSFYNTPLYNLKIDTKVNEELTSSGLFEVMNINTDEDEHSIEMQLPYIAKVMEGCPHEFTIVPILVGSLSVQKEKEYGQFFSKYLGDPDNFFVISSDFCHWGKRFRFTYHDNKNRHIYQSIEALDRMGMDLIEQLQAQEFVDYLKKYGNTICGRHPIALFLFAVQSLRQSNGPSPIYSFKFLNYAQSNSCQSMGDSSVSYAAGALMKHS